MFVAARSTALVAILALPLLVVSRADADVLGSSGWKAVFQDGASGSFTVVSEVPGESVTISITKTLNAPSPGEMPSVRIGFSPANFAVAPAPRIVISSETVENDTGLAWSEYRWMVSPSGKAAFNTASAWSVSPWFDNSALQWLSTSTTSELWAGGGSGVPSGGTFTPSGSLIIDAVPSAMMMFDLKQIAVPEPSALVLILAALAGALCRRGARKARPGR